MLALTTDIALAVLLHLIASLPLSEKAFEFIVMSRQTGRLVRQYTILLSLSGFVL